MIDPRGPLGRQIAVASVASATVLMAGGAVTSLGSWYAALRKPIWQPPGWIFGPVWTLITILVVIAAVLTWRRAGSNGERRMLLAAYALNAVLNILWSVLFFAMRRPDHALVEVAFLWLSIAMLVVLNGRLSRLAGLLLLPYLAWVTFAAYLNWTIVQLNAPFTAAGSGAVT